MGTDNLFHKRKAKAAEAHSRKKASRKPYERILIVCEGEKTEPLYFAALRRALGLHPANVVIADKKRGLDPASLVAYRTHRKTPSFRAGVSACSLILRWICSFCPQIMGVIMAKAYNCRKNSHPKINCKRH